MFDLNPFARACVDVRDVQFTQLFLVWLASIPRYKMTQTEQVFAVQNYKNAARYDLNTVCIVMPELTGKAGESVQTAAQYVMERIMDFYRPLLPDLPGWVEEVLRFENAKITNPGLRYAVRARKEFSGSFLEKGIAHAMNKAD